MQIHEINQPLNEGPITRNIAAAVTNPIAAARVAAGGGSGATGTSFSSRVAATAMQPKIKDLAIRTLDAWKNYIYQVEQTIDPQDLPAFRNRSDGRYRKELLSWIQTNLSRGLYLPNAQNYGEITNVINQLSGTQAQQPAQQPTQQAAQPIRVGNQIIQPGTPQYQAITQRMQQSSQTTPESRQHCGNKKTIQEAISASQEKTLWTKLVTLVTQAQQEVDARQQQQQQQKQQKQALQTSQNAAGLLQQAFNGQGISPNTIGTINTIMRNLNQQGQIVRSTGNPLTDGLLKLLGFSIQ